MATFWRTVLNDALPPGYLRSLVMIPTAYYFVKAFEQESVLAACRLAVKAGAVYLAGNMIATMFDQRTVALRYSVEAELVGAVAQPAIEPRVFNLTQAECYGLERTQKGYELTRAKVVAKLVEGGATPEQVVLWHPMVHMAYFHVSRDEQLAMNRINMPVDVITQLQTQRMRQGGWTRWSQGCLAYLGFWPDRSS